MKKTFKKRAFISAIAMLVVSAIVLTSATFAWFSMSKQATIDEMNLSVTAPEGIQISANAKAWTSKLIPAYLFPKTTAELTDRYAAYEGNINMMPADLKPVSAAFNSSLGNNTGPVNFYGGSANDRRQIVFSRLSQSTDRADVNGFVAFDIFLKVASAQKVYFNDIAFTDTTGADALTALRVGFQVMGNVASDATQEQATSLNRFSNTANELFIYEVDSVNRSADAKAAGHSNGAITTKPVFTALDGTLDATDYVLTGGGAILDNYFCKLVKNGDSTANFQINAGITKIRVYVWMEGQDIDCRNSIAGSIITGKIQFGID